MKNDGLVNVSKGQHTHIGGTPTLPFHILKSTGNLNTLLEGNMGKDPDTLINTSFESMLHLDVSDAKECSMLTLLELN